MIIYAKVTEIFCLVDEFCKQYDLVVEETCLAIQLSDHRLWLKAK